MGVVFFTGRLCLRHHGFQGLQVPHAPLPSLHYVQVLTPPVVWRERFARPCHLKAALSIRAAPVLVRKTPTATGMKLIQSVSRSTIPIIAPLGLGVTLSLPSKFGQLLPPLYPFALVASGR